MNKFIIIPALMAVLAGCNKFESIQTGGDKDPISIKIACELSTKAPIMGTTMPTTRNIVMAAYHNAAQGSDANYFKNVTFSRSSSNIWVCDKYWPLNGSLDFLGYSLDNNSRVSAVTWGTGSKGYTSSVTMTLADNHSNQDDLLVGGSSANTASATNMAMKHAQSLLTFKARANVGYTAPSGTNFGITITDIKINNAYYSGTVACTRTNGDIAFSWSDRGSQQASMTVPTFTATNVTATSSFMDVNCTNTGCLVVPQNCTTITIYYTIHNGKDDGGNNIDNPMQYTFTHAGGATWDPMKKYIYNIDFTLTGITVNVTVTNWADQSATSVPIPA